MSGKQFPEQNISKRGTMDYEDFFETLVELLATLNGAVPERTEMSGNNTAAPSCNHMIDKKHDVFAELDIDAFTLSPWH